MNIEAEADALAEKYPNHRPGPTCTVGISPHRSLIEALSSRGLYATRVSEIMKTEKQAVFGTQAIRRHVKGDCQCQK